MTIKFKISRNNQKLLYGTNIAQNRKYRVKMKLMSQKIRAQLRKLIIAVDMDEY